METEIPSPADPVIDGDDPHRQPNDGETAVPSCKRRGGQPGKRRRGAKRQRTSNAADVAGTTDDDAIGLTDLPAEITLAILSHCSAVDVARMGMACRWAAAVVFDPPSMRQLYRRAVGASCTDDPLCMGRFGDVVDVDYFAAADPAPLNVVRLADCGRHRGDNHGRVRSTRIRSPSTLFNSTPTVSKRYAPPPVAAPRIDGDGRGGLHVICGIDSTRCRGRHGLPKDGCDDCDENGTKSIPNERGEVCNNDDDDGGGGDNGGDSGSGPTRSGAAAQTRAARKQAVVSTSACGLPTPVVPAERLARDDPCMPCGRRVGAAEIAAVMEEAGWRCGHLPPSLAEAIGPLRCMALAEAAAESAAGTRRGSAKKRGGARLVKTIRRTGLGHTSTVAWGFWREGRLVGPGLVARASCRADVGARFDARWALAWEDDMTRSDGRYRPGASAPFVQRTWRVVGARTGATVTCGDATGALGAAMTSTTDDGATVSALVGPATRAAAYGTTVVVGPGRVVRSYGSRTCETVAPVVGIDEMDACMWTSATAGRSDESGVHPSGTVRAARDVPIAGTDVAVYRGAVDAADRPHGHGAVYALDASLDRETVVYEGSWQGGVAHGWGRLFDPTLPAEAHRDARPLFVGYFCKGAPVGSGSLSPAPGCTVEAAGWWAAAEDDDVAYTPAPRGSGVVHLPCGAQLTCDWQRAGAPPVVYAVRHRDAALGRAVDAGDCVITVEALDTPRDSDLWAAAIEQTLLDRTDALCQMAPIVPHTGSRTAARWMGSALTAPSLRFRVRCGDSPDAVIAVDLASMIVSWV
ncbi:F-box domain-containing protein [Pandoravirus kuranda]|uniref:F-box domain-containing protein n=1 Tax=Pandoravirus kuranda TaxID=3019033 RepID=A0AA95ENR7_9VIRU|nr:F-box domain-containing protein [Pandoravirus kuranda]